MLSTLIYTSLIVLAPVLRVAAFAVNSPDINSCGDVHISWEPKKAPYSVWIINPEDPCEEPYVDLGADHMGTTMTWNKAAIPVGLKVQIAMQDRNGDEAWSDIIEVGTGSDTSCNIPEALAALAPETTSSVEATTAATEVPDGTTMVVSPTTTTTSEVSVAPVAAGAAKDNGFGGSNGAASVKGSTSVVLVGALVGAMFVAL